VAQAGVCNTDLEIVRGYAGFRGVVHSRQHYAF
jgi:hypothetical protein